MGKKQRRLNEQLKSLIGSPSKKADGPCLSEGGKGSTKSNEVRGRPEIAPRLKHDQGEMTSEVFGNSLRFQLKTNCP